MRIDRERCERAMRCLSVSGNPTNRHSAIADAIAAIQANGEAALSKEYIGIKNYAGFGDQREDHPYGYGPKHGSIVFRISKCGDRNFALGSDHVYLLECVRDFGVIEAFWTSEKRKANLCDVLAYSNKIANELAQIMASIEGAEVDSHEIAPCASPAINF